MATSLIPDESPPDVEDRNLEEYLARMFRYARLSDENSDQLTLLTAVPLKPKVGKIYYFAEPIPSADIAYEGAYLYKSDGRWWALADLAVGAAWDDNIADLTAARSVGSGTPTLIQVNGGFSAPNMTQAPLGSIILQTAHHIKHDSAEGKDIYPHVHWTNDTLEPPGGTPVSVTFDISIQLAAGHDQANFPAPTLYQITHTITPPQARQPWRHFITEGANPVTQAFPAPEVDSLILVRTSVSASTLNGNALGLYVDLHYQRERISTVSKAPDFYT